MTFSESIFVCLRKYFEVKGRASKSEFWWFQLLWMVCFGLNYSINLEPLNYFLLGIMIIILIPLFTVGVRRLHDTNKSGLHYLWSLIPFIGSFIVLGLMIGDGTKGKNKYGNNPLKKTKIKKKLKK